MSYLLESTIPNLMLQPSESNDMKEDQEKEHTLLGIYDHVNKSQGFGKTYLNDQAESWNKTSYLGDKKQAIKRGRIGETRDKLIPEQPASKLRTDQDRNQAIDNKERHNKVCTSRGLRDRRVRLSAHTAIKFYDLQDRLGYDQPSKAIDWLIEKAKQAIKAIAAELPNQNHDSVGSDIAYIVPQRVKQVVRDQSMNVNNMDSEVIFSMSSPYQNCPTDHNSIDGHFQDYEDPYGYDLQHSNRVGFAEQVINSTSNVDSYPNTTDTSRIQIPIAFSPLIPVATEQPLLVHKESQFLSQRGTLQSINFLSLVASSNPPNHAHGNVTNVHESQATNSNLLYTKGFSSGGYGGI